MPGTNNRIPHSSTKRLKRMKCFRMREKKVKNTLTPPTHLPNEQTTVAAEVPMPMTPDHCYSGTRNGSSPEPCRAGYDRGYPQRLCHRFMHVYAQVYTDENPRYDHLIRPHAAVCHAKHEYARDANSDSCCEVNATRLKACGLIAATFCTLQRHS